MNRRPNDRVLPVALAGRDPGTDAPDVLRIQPMPVVARVARLRVGGRVATAIYREWRPGDPARCRLCPACAATADTAAPSCLVLLDGAVADRDAALYAPEGRSR